MLVAYFALSNLNKTVQNRAIAPAVSYTSKIGSRNRGDHLIDFVTRDWLASYEALFVSLAVRPDAKKLRGGYERNATPHIGQQLFST